MEGLQKIYIQFMETVKIIGIIIQNIVNANYKAFRARFDPRTKQYFLPVPNADTVLSILPILLFIMLLLTAIFATYFSYQRVLFLPDTTSNNPYSWLDPSST